MSKLLILRGLPASGKSTYAKGLVEQGWKRVNKDDLRSMIDGGFWSGSNETDIVDVEQDLVTRFLKDGFNVVVDDTNFGHEFRWGIVAETCGAEYDIRFFDVPFTECIKRDAKRGDKSVGEKVIYRMWEKHLQPRPPEYNPDLPNCYIFDIDGTLAKMVGRSPYDYEKVSTDIVNEPIGAIFRMLRDTRIVVSGRKALCEEDTKQWLLANDLNFKELFMRGADDERDDRIVKREIYEKYIKGKYNVLAVFDDRDRVVEMWRGLGLTCLQVNWGNF